MIADFRVLDILQLTDNKDNKFSRINLMLFQALADAIQSVTDMNPDWAVEKIEVENHPEMEINGSKHD